MKAVVTGGCGFIGSHMVDRLIDEGFEEVIAIDNCSTGRVENLDHHKDNPKVKIVLKDIALDDSNLDEDFVGADFVYHYAALADIVPSVQNPDTYYKSNVTGTFKVLEAARKIKGLKKLVYAASSTCFGIPDNYPTAEDADIRPQYPYAMTKRMGEELVLYWGQLYDIPVISTRFFNVYGPRSRTSGTYGAVFGVFLAQKLAGEPMTVVGDGEQTRDFTFVTDIVDAVYTASQSEYSNEVFNVGSGNTYSVNLLVQLLGGEKTHIPKRPGEPDCTFADNSKITKMLNWAPKVKFEDGVKIMLDHIDYWKEAPVWTPKEIEKATKPWFDALS